MREEYLSDSPSSAHDREFFVVPEFGVPGDPLDLKAALFAGIIGIAADAIVSVDEGQRIILFNRGAERMFGYAAAEVLRQSLDILIPEPVHIRRRDAEERSSESPIAALGMGERDEVVGRRKSGELFPAEAAGSTLEIGGRRIYTAVLRDVTDRKQAELEHAQLLEREHAARAIAEAAEQRSAFLADASALLDRSLDYETTLQSLAHLVVPRLAAVCLIDVADGGAVRRVAAATATASLTGTTRALLQYPERGEAPYLTRVAIESGRPVLVRSATRDALATVTQHPEHLRLLLELHPQSYMIVPLLARGRTLGAMAFIAAGEDRPYGTGDLAFAEELAHRAALAVDNARLYGAAQRATQARDEMLGIVSHDLRNPLSAIALCASALEESLVSPDESIRYMVDTIQQSSEWMNRLIQDLLDIANIETGHLSIEPRPEPVAPLLAQLRTMFAAMAADADVTFALEAAPDVPPVLVDRERILQVLANLVANALKFTPASGTISVRAELDGTDPHSVRFTVRDTGRGIPPEHLPHLFDRFWQARRGARERGTGLGLAISKGIVEAHGGRIVVESEEGRGSTFAFEVPRAGGEDAG